MIFYNFRILATILVLFTICCKNNSTKPDEKLQSNWVNQESNTYAILREVFFINKEVGWVVGNGGTILKTKNGGKTWEKVNSPTTVSLFSVYFFDENTGWIMGDYQTRIFTEDGGNSWSTFSDGESTHYHSLCFANDSTGFALNSGTGSFIKTVDGGKTWTLKSISNSIGAPIDLFFINESRGWIVGSQKYIAYSSDGGESFNTIKPPDDFSFFDHVFFANENVGWITGNSCWILSSDNGGNSWNRQVECGFDIGFLNDIFFLDEKTGWIVGGIESSLYKYSTIFTTRDGGKTWNEERIQGGNELMSVFFRDMVKGWVVGRNGSILRYAE